MYLVVVSLDRTVRHTHGGNALEEWSARRRGLYLHNNHNRRTSIPSAGFQPAIPAIERPQTVRLTQSATPLLYLIIPYQQCGLANFWVESHTFPVSRLLYSPSVSTRFEILHSCCVISFCDVVWHHSLNACEIWYEGDCGRHLEVALKTTNGCDSRLATETRDLCLRTLQRLTLICIVCKGSARTAQ